MAATAYKILSASVTDPERLVALVTAAIADEWQPTGPITTSGVLILQPMVQGTPVSAADYELPAAAAETLGGVLQGAVVADAVDTDDIVAQFNALLTSLRAAGTIATAAE